MSVVAVHARGKIILTGEHAVVYERPALAVSMEPGLEATAWSTDDGEIALTIEGRDTDTETAARTAEAAAILRERAGPGPGVRVRARAHMPLGAGLGGSAAVAVLLVRALAAARGAAWSDETVREHAHALEVFFHGRSSGLDDTVCTFGGTIWFSRAGTAAAPPGTPLTARAVRLAASPPPLVVAVTPGTRSTRAMVERVRDRRIADPDGTNALFDAVAACTGDAVNALLAADDRALGAVLNRNHALLCELGVSTPALDRAVAVARAAGAYGAKLTGAGGGGSVVAACSPEGAYAVQNALARAGLATFLVGGRS